MIVLGYQPEMVRLHASWITAAMLDFLTGGVGLARRLMDPATRREDQRLPAPAAPTAVHRTIRQHFGHRVGRATRLIHVLPQWGQRVGLGVFAAFLLPTSWQ